MGNLLSTSFFPLALAGLAGLIFLKVFVFKKKKKDWSKSGQIPWRFTNPKAPGDGAGLLAGVRVVEIASVFAAPSCSRIFADLGAEVIKVEGPANCDSMRDNLLKYANSERQARRVGLLFEGLNPGKASVIIDLKKNRQEFIELLTSADVLITNIRKHQIRKLRLDYDQIKDEVPHLVVGQLNAWGREGADSTLPGFDLTAFWCASGLAHATYSPKEFMYSCYPAGFGDITTGMGLFAGIVGALAERLKTKKGALVTNCLYRQGVFANALALCASDNTLNPTKRMLEHDLPNYANPRPNRSPSNEVYGSSDQKYFAVVASAHEADAASAELADALDCDNSTEGVGAALSSMPFADIESLMQKLRIPVVVKTDSSVSPVDDPRYKNLFTPFVSDTAAPSDCPKLVKIPLNFSCSDKHGAQFPASTLGCHTQSFKQKGWAPRDEQAFFTLADTRDVVVVELCEQRSSSVAAGTLQFMKHVSGCQVIRILTESAYWAERNPSFEAMLSEGKQTRKCDIEKVREELVRIAKGGASVIFVTNERVTLLRENGLDYESLKTVIPDIVVVLVTPFDSLEEQEEARGEMGGFTIASPIGELYSGVRAAPEQLPSQMGELCVSMTVLGALTSAHFHRLRTGEGQLVNLSLQGAGLWSTAGIIPVCYNRRFWSLLRQLDSKDTEPLVGWDWMKEQMPLYSSFKTKDGAFVCITPVTAPRLIKHDKAMGLLVPMLTALFCGITKAKLTGGDALSAAFTAMASVNTKRRKFVEGKTLEEFRKFAEEKDVWWSPVITPKEVFLSEVASSTNAISGSGKDWSIQCPVQRE